MKTAKELIERLQNDEAFAKEYTEALKAKQESGTNDVYESVIPVAAGFGYEITNKDIDEIRASADEELSADELGNAAGGTFAIAGAVAAVLFGTGVAAIVKEVVERNT
ncbi:MAG: hypothetical protein IK093_05130 [Ruminiclostridium sp.]|nr:hypothetical protein [Ruminiclostridium sp.]